MTKCLKIQDDILRKQVGLQEESLLLGIRHREILRWSEKGNRPSSGAKGKMK
jgi:hypothetical protein